MVGTSVMKELKVTLPIVCTRAAKISLIQILYYTKWVVESQERLAQLAFTCSKLTIETIEQGVKYVQSQQ